MTKRKLSSKTAVLFLLLATLVCLFVIHRFHSAPSGSWVREEQQVYYKNRFGNTVTGWQIIAENQYYFHPDGTMATGWLDLNGSRYYFAEDGTMVTGWKEIDGKQYYFSTGGRAVSGWQGIDGQRYYFYEDCTLSSGLVTAGEKRYLFLEDGSPATGWVEYQDQKYYVNSDGSLYTGWLTEGEYRYYFLPDGTMAVGETLIDGQRLYFSPQGIHITLVNPWHYMPEGYRVEQVAITEDYTVDKACYEALKNMLAACEAAGLEPIICSAYRSQADQEWLYDRKVTYYLEEEGLSDKEARKQAGRSVAVPGTSEHQLGLAVDIVSSDYYVLDESQATTQTQQWLMEHCWEYGFILRYPVDKSHITGIIYEPWHYRYVGVAVAQDIRASGLCLEEYLDAVSYG